MTLDGTIVGKPKESTMINPNFHVVSNTKTCI